MNVNLTYSKVWMYTNRHPADFYNPYINSMCYWGTQERLDMFSNSTLPIFVVPKLLLIRVLNYIIKIYMQMKTMKWLLPAGHNN